MQTNQKINCNVATCKHNDMEHACTLSSILVDANSKSATNQDSTLCKSFATL